MAVANQGGSDGAGTVGILLGHGDGTFQNNQDPFVGSEPISLAVGDFNEDGRSDLAVANYGDNTVSILISNGDRTFKTKADYAVGSEPMCVAVGDFNGDGHSDLAVANFDSGMGSTVSIMMGKGDGTFESKVDYTAGYGPCSLAVGDFNHDGKSDLAVVDRDDGTIMLLLNQGDGTFSGYPVATLHCVAYSIGVGDFDNDGMTDFAAANWTGSGVCIGWAKDNTGDRFNTSSYQVSGAPYSVAVGDYNGDGHSDLAVACQFGYVDIYCFGNNYPTGVNRMRYTVGNDARSVAVGDFDGDGKGDLAVANYGDNTVSILRGNGDGSFQLKTDYPVGKQPTCVAVGDFDGDGRSDLAVANYGDDRVSIGWNLIGTTTVLTSSSGTTVTGQSVTFTATITPASGNGMTGTVQFQVDGGNVGNPVAVSGGTAAYTTSALPVGSHSITAVYSGDASFAGSTSVALSQSVSKVAPKISWGAPAAITYGVRLSGGQLNATADVPGAFVYDTPVGTVLPAGSQTLRVTFTPNDAANYLTTTATVPLTVNKAILLVTTDPKTKTYGQVNPALTGTLTDLVAVDGITAIWATAAGQFDHPGNYAITATLSDPNNKLSNYAVTNAGSTLTISKAGQTLTWATPAAITNGLPLGSGQLNASVTGVASGSTPGSLSYTPAAGAVLSAGNNTLTVTAAATADYNQASKSVILTVNPNTAPVGSIDACDRTVVRGWAFDQDFGAGSILVRVDLDGVTGTPFAANLARADLASYAPVGSPNHGFSFAMPTLGAGSHTVDVWVQDSPGTAYMKLGTRTIPASVTPFGSVDACDRTKVAGWAFDGDAGDASILVRVDVDGVAGTPFVANLSRADLTSYAPVGSPKHGFSFTMPTLSPAAHTVAVYAQDVAGNGLVLISPTKTLPATVSSGGGAVLTPKAGDAKSFFDEAFYLAANPDVAAAVKAGAITAWNHFWNYGQYEGRRPSNLYDEKFYLATYTDIAGAVKAGSFKDGFAHFVTYGYAEGRKGVVTPKAGDAKSFFDPGYYLARNPDVAAVVKAGTITAWDHFWNHGQYEGRRPSSIYDESFYLATYPDIAAAVKAGVFKDGFAHFAAYGFGEGRKGVGA